MSNQANNPTRLEIARLDRQISICEANHTSDMALLGSADGSPELQVERRLEQTEADLIRLRTSRNKAYSRLNQSREDELIRYLAETWQSERRTLEQIFRESLPPSSWIDGNALPDAIGKMIKTLGSKAGRDQDCAYTPLVIFVGKLIAQPNLYVQNLQDWLIAELAQSADIALEYRNFNTCLTVAREYRVRHRNVASCLLVRVTCDAQASARENQRRYGIQGWYIDDIERYQDNYDRATNIYLAGEAPDQQIPFVAAELEGKIRALVDRCFDEGKENPGSLHMFLPAELMGQPIDSWNARPPEYESAMTFGTEHPEGFFIRCDERLTNKRVGRKDWKARWELLKQTRAEPNSQLFWLASEGGCAALERQFRDRRRCLFGLKLIGVPQRPEKGVMKRNSFFSLLARSPIPAAVWLRQELASRSCEDILNEVLDSGLLDEIPEAVYQKRLYDDSIGQHLSLLWDDPHLLPPDFQTLVSA